MKRIKFFFNIELDRGEPLACVTPVASPEGFRLERGAGCWRISWRWITWRAIAALLFVAAWNGLLAAVIYAACSSQTLPQWLSAVLLLGAAIGIAVAYMATAHLLNRTTIYADSERISVRHGPLPWPGHKDFPRATIERVLSERFTAMEDSAWSPSVTYSVTLLLKGGGRARLVYGLTAPEQALFIEQRIGDKSACLI